MGKHLLNIMTWRRPWISVTIALFALGKFLMVKNGTKIIKENEKLCLLS
jgi:hypothetical protein